MVNARGNKTLMWLEFLFGMIIPFGALFYFCKVAIYGK